MTRDSTSDLLKIQSYQNTSYIKYYLKREVSIALHCQLCSTHYTAFRIKNCSKNTFAIHIYRKKKWCCASSYINYHLKSEVPITLCCWLCSTCYIAVRIKNCSKSTSAIRVATMKYTDDFCFEGKPSRATAKSTLSLSAKMNGTQRRTLVSPRRMYCTYCGMLKGTSLAEAMSNSEKIKPVALAIIELHL